MSRHPSLGSAPGRLVASCILILLSFAASAVPADNAPHPGLDALMSVLDQTTDPAVQRDVLVGMHEALKGRRVVAMPAGWGATYDKLAASDDAAIREQARVLAMIFGDPRALGDLRKLAADAKAPMAKRREALQSLVDKKDPQLAPVLHGLLEAPALRGQAVRALAAYDHPRTPALLLSHYAAMTPAQRGDAIATLAARPRYAHALLDAVDAGQLTSKDVHAFTVRQLRNLGDASLEERIAKVWGVVRESPAEKKRQIEHYKRLLTPQTLAKADTARGRLIYNKTCASCHALFGQGGQVGPELTGSNRGNLDYLLENLIDPSALVGKDYQLTLIETADGRTIAGLIMQESANALTVRTINDTVVVDKADVDSRRVAPTSMMPEGLLAALPKDEARDLIAYLQSPTQTPLAGSHSRIDPKTKRVPGALEGEQLQVVQRTGGASQVQPMGAFPLDKWSGDAHLWWINAKPGDMLTLGLPVKNAGRYEVEIALTKAVDYGIVQILLNDEPVTGPIDLYNDGVISTGPIDLGAHDLSAGDHRLTFRITGANPKAVKRYMVGVDYVNLIEVR